MKQRKNNTNSNNSIKFPLWIVLLGLLSFFIVGFRVCQLALNEEKVIFGGRLAEYKYYDMDDVIKKALDIELV